METAPRKSIASAAVASRQAAAAKPRPDELVLDELPPLPANPRPDELVLDELPPLPANPRPDELVLNDLPPLPAEPAKPKKPKTTRKPRQPVNTAPWNSLSALERMKLFYTYRAAYPAYFTYSAEGNLEIKPNNPYSVPAGTIMLRAFSSLRPEELEEVEQKQKETQVELEDLYVQKLKELRAISAASEANPSDLPLKYQVVKVNEELRALSQRRTEGLYPERWTRVIPNPEVRSILLAQTYEERKLGYDVFLFKRYSLPFAVAEGAYRVHGESADQSQVGGRTEVLFIKDAQDEKTGIFHPTFEREFVFHETRYSSPYQAFLVEQVKEDEPLVEKLLGTRSAKTMRVLVKDYPRSLAGSPKLWEEIYEALLTQHPDLAEKLKATGSASFHTMDPLYGDPAISLALTTVRTKLKEHEDEAPSGIEEVKESVISREQQQKDKVGAIIHSIRRR